MRIQALPVGQTSTQPKPDGDDAPAVPANDSCIQTGPVVIYTYGTIGSTAAESQADDR